MLDFLEIEKNSKNKLYPNFVVKKRYKDLMIKGSDFMAFYNEETGYWCTDIHEMVSIIDKELDKRAYEDHIDKKDILYVKSYNTKRWDELRAYMKRQTDRYKELDRKILFNNAEVTRESYATFKLPYNIEEAPIPAWDEMMETLYPPEERAKIEWAIGAVISGDSKRIQKFLVMYGDPGSGKGTILEIIQKMFDGYWGTFSCETIGNASNSFSLEQFKKNPLIGIDPDGDLSKININTRLNTVVSHEPITVNEKFKSAYTMKIDTFLFVATNNPVKITDSKSGLIRRLIDVYPSGNRIPYRKYMKLKKDVMFECGGIAARCLKVYNEMGEDYYNEYEPTKMIYLTDDIKNFLTENFDRIAEDDYVEYKKLWNDYRVWCEDNNVKPVSGREFKKNINDYFVNHDDEKRINGMKVYNVFYGFKTYKFKGCVYSKKVDDVVETVTIENDIPEWLDLRKLDAGEKSILDIALADSKARKANHHGKPDGTWDECVTKLRNINTSNLHFVIPKDEHQIFIDFDIKDKDGNKSLSENIKRAAELGLPATYAETSKSGGGLHLHYIYDGDIRQLSSVMDDNVEIKVFPNDKKSSMRRKLTLCNNLPIAHISSGLPLRKENQKEAMLNSNMEITERYARRMIKRCINKEYEKMPKTVMNVMFIKKLLDDLYSSGKTYDCSDMFHVVHTFASSSTNSASKCLELVADMKWCSKEYEQKAEGVIPLDISHKEEEDDRPMTFYDVEVFPNLFVICWKHRGDPETVRMINPSPDEVRKLFDFKLVGFNNRDYDNHILYAAANGYSNEALFKVSQGIIKGDKSCKFGNAYNLSYTDIYDFSNDKKSLKKWEIELGIHHLELGLPWDKEVPKELWDKVAEYCCNDVTATEALFEHLEDTDWTTRIILSELSGLSRNETTNNHTQQIIFGNDKNPQKEFIYTDLSKEFPGYKFNPYESDSQKKSTYRGYYTKEGGYADGIEGIWYDVALLDIASMHPTTAKELQIFGPRYTPRYYSLVETRLHIKHGEIDEARAMFDGLIGKIIDKYGLLIKKIDKALKIPINAVYGLTSAKFKNRCRDPRNVDNIVAKRGALFMITLRDEVRKLGYEVVHVKTDSVKIPNATPEIIKFVMDFGKKYGYTFEHEATYEKMCLANHAVYISRYASKEWCMEKYGYIPDKNNEHAGEWTATGTQFQVPYVFKTLFSHEPIEFKDLCETKEVKSPAAIYLRLGEDKSTDQFIGRIGLFCPVIDIGGDLMRVDAESNKEGAVTGTKGYKWLESEYVKANNLQKNINKDYYRVLCDKAKETIEQYGSFDEFVA